MTRSPFERTPAVALVGVGAVSVQFGAALATRLFDTTGPAGGAFLRLAMAAAVLAGFSTLHRSRRPAGRRPTRGDLIAGISFGVVLGAMNLCFYEAIDRIPLGVAVTLEFWGPLALAVVGSRRLSDAGWAAAAGAGVALLASGTGRRLDPAGVALALLAGLFWIGYILLSQQAGRRFDALDGLAIAMVAGAAALAPVGIITAGRSLLSERALGLGAAVSVLSSLVPYSLELVALRRVTSRAFGVMLALDPALATAAGWAVLGQHLTWAEWVALVLVVGANLGNSLLGRPAPVTTAP